MPDLTNPPATATQSGHVTTTTQEFLGNKTFFDAVDLQGALNVANVEEISLTGTQNNVVVNGLTNTIRFTPASALDITGIAVSGGNVDGRILILHNTQANIVRLMDQDAGSSAVNRFDFGTGIQVIGSDASIMLRYDGSTQRWRAVAHSWGDNISVNGSTTINDNFNDTLPAAVGSGVNAKWQVDSATQPYNVSAYIQDATGSQGGIVTTGAQNFAGDKTFDNAVTVAEEFALTGDTTPSSFGSDQNNFDPGVNTILRVAGSTTMRRLTGISGGTDGRRLILRNIGSNAILLTHEDTGSTAANRFDFGTYDLPLFPKDQIELMYDATLSRWVCFNAISKVIPPARFGYYYMNDLQNTTLDNIISSQVSGTGAANTMTVINNQNPGEISGASGTTTTGRTAIASTLLTSSFMQGVNNQYYRFEVVHRIPTLSTAAQTYTTRIGFIDSVSAEPANGIYFRYTHGTNSGQWQLVARSASAETATNSSSAPSAGTDYRLTICIYSTSKAEFYVNGTSIGTVTSGLPSGQGFGFGVAMIKSAGTTSVNWGITDYIEVIQYFGIGGRP